MSTFPRFWPLAAFATVVPAQDPGAVPTWARDVAPIVYRACASCHRPGQPAPFPLLGFDDAWPRRAKVAEATASRTMPPWLMTHGRFADDRRLADSEIAVIQRWVAAGGPRGDQKEEPAAPQFASGWQLREPSLVVRVPVAVAVPAAGADVVRNLVVPVEVDRLRYVEAIEIRPGNRAVHHAVLGVDGTHESRRLDAADAEPGFAGMTLGGAGPPDGHFLGWTPGKTVRVSPNGQAWRLRPGDDFVLQLHLVPTGKAETVQPEIGLFFTDWPTTTTFVPLLLFSEAIDIAPGQRDFTLRDHLELPVPVTLHAIYPHAHYVCRTMRGTATLPGGEQRVLFGTDAWDFDWQDDYRFHRPIELPAGARIAIEYGYDNSEHNPNALRPLRAVRFGQASADEMGTLTLEVAVAPGDRARLEEASVARQLEKVPDAWNVLLQQARLLRSRGDVAAALPVLAKARTISPGSADIPVEQGLCAESQGRLDDAKRCYEEALRVEPGKGLAHLQLGVLMGRQGNGAVARRHFERALVALPNSAVVHNNFATACFHVDELEPAATHYRRAVALDPEYFNAWFNFGRVLARLGRKDEARTALQKAAALRPDDKQVLAELDALGR
ncbi:MAG: tetratricopeptide repeat protein [Planctomycetota bacterium]